MKKIIYAVLFIISAALIYIISSGNDEIAKGAITKTEKMQRPSDWFFQQRAYPFNEIPFDKYFEAINEKNAQEQMMNSDNVQVWLPSGPSNIGGRITAVVVDPNDPNIIIAGAAAGGIFKTTNGGLNWSPRTDQFPSLSIGALAMHPVDHNVIYCGTGEANSAIDNYPGFGILRSTDQGNTWNIWGLSEALYIGAIDINPLNPNIMFAAVLAHKSRDDNKGIYRSTNAGVNWERVLFVSDSTSGIDVNIDPQNPNVVHAAMWERVRTPPTISKTGGLTSGMWRSMDGGTTWILLGPANGLPAPSTTTGRITIDAAPSDPNVVYALYATTIGNGLMGFYRSQDKGLTWTQMPLTGVQHGGFTWYFGLVETDPTDANKIYIGDVDLWRSTTGGGNWVNITTSYSGNYTRQHPDQHALWIHPSQPNNIINGNDGGIYKTSNGGTNWNKSYDLPISQFYAAQIDHKNPVVKIGGTQDNGTLRTTNGGIDSWQMIYGADGFRAFIDSSNSSFVYACYQNGGLLRSTNGGSTFFSITAGLDLTRTNWNTPYILDPANQATIYFGSYKVFMTTNRGSAWTAISPDLTRGPNGRLGTLTCISAEALPDGRRVIYTGSDDAKISVTTNTGANWTDVTNGLPNRYMTDVQADKRNPAIAYLTLSGFFVEDKSSHVFRTTNYGANWINISSNLLNVPVNSIVIDYNYDSLLYIGGDAGVYYTTNLGASWQLLGSELPNSPAVDLVYHHDTKRLFAATHGRSMFEIDMNGFIGIKTLSNDVPEEFRLYQNYPNPFNPKTVISFQCTMYNIVMIKIYDVMGREVEILVDEELPPGKYEVEWDGSKFASGVYYYSLSVGDNLIGTRKMVLMK